MLSNSHALGEVLYRKLQIYDSNSLNGASDGSLRLNSLFHSSNSGRFETHLMCGAPLGGPIATTCTSSRCSPSDRLIHVYTSAGRLLCTISHYSTADSAPVLNMGWSSGEHLFVVNVHGHVRIFDIRGKSIGQLSLVLPSDHPDPCPPVFTECLFWTNGIAALSSQAVVHVAEGFSAAEIASQRYRIYQLGSGLAANSSPRGSDLRTCTCMGLLPPPVSRSGLLEVMLGTSDHSILLIYESRDRVVVEDQLLQTKLEAPVVRMAVSPSGKFLACFRSDGWLTVMSAAFTTKILDFDVKTASPPTDIAWCGDDSLLLAWKNTGVLMVGPYGHWLSFPYSDGAPHLVPEPDGCRVFSSAGGCELLQRISPATVSIRSVGSTDPAALLFDAMEAFEEGDPKSDDNIRSISVSNQMLEAIDSCIQAAAGEIDIGAQQSFLRAASYGKAFCPDVDPVEFVNTSLKLRVLNDVRKPAIGLPITMQQLHRLTPEVLVGRLAVRGHHFLALKVCELLKLSRSYSGVLTHWSCEKIRRLTATSMSDDDIYAVIQRQLEPYKACDLSYLASAEAAHSMNRRRLATLLLERERKASLQIPLLLRMNEEELALQKAVQSRDLELMYFTLISLDKRLNHSGSMPAHVHLFHRIVHSHPEALDMLKRYYKHQHGPLLLSSDNRSKLQQVLLYNKGHLDAGLVLTMHALEQATAASKLQSLREASHVFGQGKDTGFHKAAVDEHLDLLELQRTYELRCQQQIHFADLSVLQTAEKLLSWGLEKPLEARWTEPEIAKITKRFRVPEKALWHLRIHCCAAAKEWGLLARLAAEKKSPVGYKPFARACIEHNQPLSDTEQYIEKISSLDERFELFMELKLFRKAADTANRLKDAAKLQEIGRTCKDPTLERQIQDFLSRM